MINPYDFSGKKYIVTGASSGMGRSVSKRLSEQGAQVVLLSRRRDKLEETAKSLEGDNHIIIPVDLESVSDLTDVFNEAVADGKKIDGIVHCAGVSPLVPIGMVTREKLQTCMNVNLYSFFELIRLFSKKKYHEATGAIVGVSSIAVEAPSKCQSIYVASKAAMSAAIKPIAMELVSKNIRINCVEPGFTDTEMLRDSFGYMSPEVYEEGLKYQLLGLTKPEEIADSIMFLLSDASSSMTGRVLFTDGGRLGI